ncbi:flavin reductase family protein [Novosphingobium sp. 1949]|uniref:Flavin reductase family protein n=1 Tax=Novosphingobium organovorum TaxID=2930092 RepID=A0ABT0BDW8_9SPHN|nr:flavin reductase family protein [Novosphingobium organovorum]MCJ2183189.1 flavin reductase family protein [Novosphingobium organovorum]
MDFDFATLTPAERYKLLGSSITPRPIAWITTQSAAGLRNAAPFSFFNAMGANPPLLAIGIMQRPDGSLKDTAANILETGEFVVHLVSEAMAHAMNLTCIDAPADYDEIAMAALETEPSTQVTPPRLAGAPVAMECRLHQAIPAGTSTIVLGEVLHFHIADGLADPERLHVDTLGLDLVARMHGGGWYARQTDLFDMPRPRFEDWKAAHEGKDS